MQFIIAYDIAHPRRLARVARTLEKRAWRHQKSVFLFNGDTDALAALVGKITPLLDLRQDCVQAWRISPDQPPQGLKLGVSTTRHAASTVVGGPGSDFVGASET